MQVLSLADVCAQHLALRVTPHNCVAWLQIADTLPSATSALRAPCFALVCAQLHRLPSRALLSYPSSLLCDILLSDLLTVPNELFVLQLALDWMLVSEVRLYPTFRYCSAFISSCSLIRFIYWVFALSPFPSSQARMASEIAGPLLAAIRFGHIPASDFFRVSTRASWGRVYPLLHNAATSALSLPQLPGRRNYLGTVCLTQSRPCKTLRQHTAAVSALLVHGCKVVSGSYDKTVRVFNPEADWACEYTSTVHTGAVYCLAATSRYLCSGGADSIIQVYDASNLVPLCVVYTLTGHTLAVSCLCVLESGLLASGSNDRTIRIWELEKFSCLRVLNGHTDAVSCLTLSGNFLWSGAYDKTLRQWSWRDGVCAHVIVGHPGTVHTINVVSDGRLVSGAKDGALRVWLPQSPVAADGSPVALKKAYPAHAEALWVALASGPDVLLSGSLDKSIKVWDLATMKSDRELVGHSKGVLALAVSGSTLISGSLDSTIIVWG